MIQPHNPLSEESKKCNIQLKSAVALTLKLALYNCVTTIYFLKRNIKKDRERERDKEKDGDFHSNELNLVCLHLKEMHT